MLKQDSSTPSFWTSLRRCWQRLFRNASPSTCLQPPLLMPISDWPAWARECPLAHQLRQNFHLLAWESLPTPSPRRFGHALVPLSAYIGAFLVQLDQGLPTHAHLRRFLVAHPALVWGLGFPVTPASTPYGFDPRQALPSQRHFNWVLRHLPQAVLQTLLDKQIAHLQRLLPDSFGRTIALDTKHILAWVKENNPKHSM